ncbi:MAG: class I SAM-dependent methyltransferase [Anaerolineales bacterium]
MLRKLFFTLQYFFNNPPWDTGVTPPELYAFLEEKAPGHALDLGCGTGTNALTMANYGWQVTGIDYIPQAIRTARRKARQSGLTNKVEFLVGDMLKIKPAFDQYDLILDIGCFHSMSGSDINRYADYVSSHLVSGGSLLLYAHLKRIPESSHGVSDEDLALLESNLSLVSRQDGQEGTTQPSTWLEYWKR